MLAKTDFLISICTRNKMPPRWMEEQLSGYIVQWTCGLTDIALARNMQMSSALFLCGSFNIKKVVFLDDDMMVSDETILQLAQCCSLGLPVAARYSPRLEPSKLVSATVDGIPVTGLGAACVDVADIRTLSFHSRPFEYSRQLKELTWAGVYNEGWLSDDYRFWVRMAEFSGTVLYTIPELSVGHHDLETNITTWPNDDATELHLLSRRTNTDHVALSGETG